ncbi:MAG: DUF5693 family protein, partial [Acetobacteraceae bacterium]|nr:DUF5693 family protein [Acetobacteraceae bacterium]
MRIRWVLAALAVASIVTSFFVAGLRGQAVDPGNRVEVAVDLRAAAEVSRDAGVDPEAFLQALKRAGVTTLGIGPLTVGDMVQDGRVAVLGQLGTAEAGLLGLGGSGEPAPTQPRRGPCWLLTPDRLVAESVSCRLRIAGYAAAPPVARGSGWLVEVATDRESLLRATLGFEPGWDGLPGRLGLGAMAVLSRPARVVPGSVEHLLAGLQQGGDGRPVLLDAGPRDPEDGPLLGEAYREWFYRAAEGLPAGWRLVALEGGAGEPELASALAGPAGGSRAWIRGHLVEVEDPVPDLIDAARERGIRLFYLYPFGASGAGWGRLELCLDMVRRLSQGLERAGFVLGPPAGGPGAFEPPRWAMVLAALGVEAGAALLLLELGAGRGLLLALALPALAVAALCGLGWVPAWPPAGALPRAGPWAREAVALAAACVFPALGAVWAWRRLAGAGEGAASSAGGCNAAASLDGAGAAGVRGRAGSGARGAGAAGLPLRRGSFPWAALGRAVLGLALASAVSLAGGLLVTALLGDTSYAAGLRGFRGVKAAYLLPLLLVALWAWRRPAHGAGAG